MTDELLSLLHRKEIRNQDYSITLLLVEVNFLLTNIVLAATTSQRKIHIFKLESKFIWTNDKWEICLAEAA